jgi:hypothetical protein
MHPGVALINELKHGSPHLRIILPAAAAVLWTIKRITGHGHHEDEGIEDEDEETSLGQIVNPVVPGSRKTAAPRLPYKLPESKATVLLDVMIPTSIERFWKVVFQNDSNVFEQYHAGMGDRDVYVGPWRQKKADGGNGMIRRRRTSFVKPLKNPLGPRQAANQETFTIVDLSPAGFTCSCVCKTQGVPFSNSFQNELMWVGYQVEDNTMRLIVSGECVFTESVFGVLKGTIARESVSGMKKAYDTFFRRIIADQFGILEGEERQQKNLANVSGKAGITDGFMNLAQTNPAVLVALLATLIIMMRMVTTQSLYHQLLRKIILKD